MTRQEATLKEVRSVFSAWSLGMKERTESRGSGVDNKEMVLFYMEVGLVDGRH